MYDKLKNIKVIKQFEMSRYKINIPLNLKLCNISITTNDVMRFNAGICNLDGVVRSSLWATLDINFKRDAT